MKQRTKALLAAVISGAAFAGLVGGLIFWLPSYKEKKEMEEQVRQMQEYYNTPRWRR